MQGVTKERRIEQVYGKERDGEVIIVKPKERTEVKRGVRRRRRIIPSPLPSLCVFFSSGGREDGFYKALTAVLDLT
jgi:hypothetical protein